MSPLPFSSAAALHCAGSLRRTPAPVGSYARVMWCDVRTQRSHPRLNEATVMVPRVRRATLSALVGLALASCSVDSNDREADQIDTTETVIVPTTPPTGEADQCTTEDAETLLQDAISAYVSASPGPRIVDLVERCQFRLYEEEVTFHANDVILGGIFYAYSYRELDELGWTREDAIADMETIELQVSVAKVLPDGSIGELSEQPLRSTGYMDYTDSQYELVYIHHAFIIQLEVGDYICVVEESSAPAEWGDSSGTVHLHIVP